MVKPYYEESGITIYNCDCREILPSLPKVDLVLTDPPYGIGYVHSGHGGGQHNRRNTQPIYGDDQPFDPSLLLSFKNVITWGADHYAQRLPEGRWLIWDKLNGLESFDNFSDVEIAWHSKKGAARLFRYMWKGICTDGDKQWGRIHPSQKPVPLMKWCIKQAGDVGTILDPYMGSGSTLRAAKDMGCKAIGIEISKEYCRIAVERLRQETLNFSSAGESIGADRVLADADGKPALFW